MYSLLPMLLSCTAPAPSPALPADTGPAADTGGGDDFFQPAAVVVIESWLGTDGQTLTTATQPDGALLTPRLRLLFVTSEYFIDGSEAEQCQWWGELVDFAPETPETESVWLQGSAALSLLSTDCADLDPAVWSEDTPTTVMESLALTVGIGPLGNLSETLPDYYDNQGQDFDADEPYLLSAYLGLGLGSMEEYGYGMLYQTDEGGTLMTDTDGNLIPLERGESLAAGVFYAVPFLILLPDSLL